ncbi:MAG: hypothetical protein AAF696_12780, partial [Bacteroidota bacterium]
FGKKLAQSELLYFKANGPGKSICLQKVDRRIKNPPPGLVQVGDLIPVENRKSFRKSVSTLQSSSYLIHDTQGLVYKIDEAGRVIEWVLYREV